MAFDEHSQESVRAQVIDSAVKQIAKYSYKMKQLVSVVSIGAWKNYFFREQLTRLAGATGNTTKGIPRGAAFPQATLSWEKITSVIEKYGLTDTIPYEDVISDEIDVRDRTIQRIAEGVAYAVDTEIFNVLSENLSSSAIQTHKLSGGQWDESSAQIVKDIASGKKLIRDYYDNVQDFVLCINGDDEVNLTHYLYEKGAQAPTVGADMVLNGSAGKVAGAQILVTDVVPASYALLVVPKRCATWKALLPLSTDVVERKFNDTQITACEMGITNLTDPKAVVLVETHTW